MSKSNIELLIEKANRGNIDSVESEALYKTVEAHCRNFYRDVVKTSIYFYMIEKYSLYKNAGEKDTRTLLKSWGYSNGAISHLKAYGEFCCRMKFTDAQLPPEHVVRPILVRELRDDWCNIYRAACQKVLERHVETQSCECEKSPASRGKVEDDDNNDNQNSENGSENAQDGNAKTRNTEGDDEDDTEGDDEDDTEGDDEDDTEGDNEDDIEGDDEENDNSLPFEWESTPSEMLLDCKPSSREVQQTVREFKMNDPKNIYLFSIGEKMPREGNFTSEVLEKFREEAERETPVEVPV